MFEFFFLMFEFFAVLKVIMWHILLSLIYLFFGHMFLKLWYLCTTNILGNLQLFRLLTRIDV